ALESRLARYLTASALSARKVQEQKDQISRLISDISHQTKTPVANLQLYAQLLAEQPLTPQEEECAGTILTQAAKLQTLIEALVKTSRLENGILAVHPEISELSYVVDRAVTQYVPKAAEKGIVLTAVSTEGKAVFDPKWTEEALCNLLDNAVKYTPSGGAVTVTVKNYEMFSAICVTDTGPGIPEAEQARIFGRFYRSAGNYQEQGVGIGLYLTRQIAEKQGGYVKVESIPGTGSTFSLFFTRP
ncbi:MAG TPA: HAMP domain-containing histidine kinase, partial [Subdoligranulum variabile]|nr:HAMP domain-containing histidine kinase [Subdoligranulum variabile]